MNVFQCVHRIAYSGIRPDMTVSFPELVGSILEASLLHSESTPYPMAWYVHHQCGFLLTNWQVQVLRYPKWNDTLTIRTWPIRFKGILAERSFEVTDAAGRAMAFANTGWFFTDLANRRPIRASNALVEGYGPIYPPAIPKDFKMPDYTSYAAVGQSSIIVTRRDTDGNAHVNNVTYLAWAMDLIPDSVYDTLHIMEMKTVYKKECVRGMSLTAEAFQHPVDKTAFVVCVKDAGPGRALLCEMYFRFGTYD